MIRTIYIHIYIHIHMYLYILFGGINGDAVFLKLPYGSGCQLPLTGLCNDPIGSSFKSY